MQGRRGFSIVELIVSISIFVTIITLVVGGVAAITRTKMLISGMKESQQKARLITEVLSRYSKEAINVTIRNDDGVSVSAGDRLDLIFEDTGVKSAKSFIFKQNDEGVFNSLLYYSCNSSAIDPDNDVLSSSTSSRVSSGDETITNCTREELFASQSGVNFSAGRLPAPSTPFFTRKSTIPVSVSVDFILQNQTPTNNYFNDSINISRKLLLENLK